MQAVRVAVANLKQGAIRTTASIAGVMIAVLLMLMQFGFLGAVQTAATLLYDQFDFDLMVLPGEYREMLHPGSVERSRLAEAHSVPGVASVYPVWLSVGMWRDPRGDHTPERFPPRRWNILILGIQSNQIPNIFHDPDTVFPNPGGATDALYNLSRTDTVLLDRRSWEIYGDARDRQPGRSMELNHRRVTIGGDVAIGTGFGYNGLVVVSEATFRNLNPVPTDDVTLLLIKLQPGADVAAVRKSLEDLGPPKTLRVMTREEVYAAERAYWQESTSVGLFFQAGAAIAFLGGLLFVGQMMVGDILSRQKEYATLKAMGYGDAYLASVVIWQALLLSLLGYLLGLAVAEVAYRGVNWAARIPIGWNLVRAVDVLVLAVLMCLAAGAFAVYKLRSSDPAELLF